MKLHEFASPDRSDTDAVERVIDVVLLAASSASGSIGYNEIADAMMKVYDPASSAWVERLTAQIGLAVVLVGGDVNLAAKSVAALVADAWTRELAVAIKLATALADRVATANGLSLEHFLTVELDRKDTP